MSVLEKIFAKKHAEVAEAKARIPLPQLEDRALAMPTPRSLVVALRQSPDDVALIAEVKKASPSKGLIRPNFDVHEIARAYTEAGAAAMSVLTDVPHFQGSPENIRLAREVSPLPILRKDFIDDEYQVVEARAWGADAILLIVAALDDVQLRDLHTFANGHGMDVLVEVHTEAEAERALKLDCPLIGVNNRDLSDFRTSLEISDRILPLIAPHAVAVSESALESRADLDRVRDAGARAVLIGTSFCAAPDIRAKVEEVMGRPGAA